MRKLTITYAFLILGCTPSLGTRPFMQQEIMSQVNGSTDRGQVVVVGNVAGCTGALGDAGSAGGGDAGALGPGATLIPGGVYDIRCPSPQMSSTGAWVTAPAVHRRFVTTGDTMTSTPADPYLPQMSGGGCGETVILKDQYILPADGGETNICLVLDDAGATTLNCTVARRL